MLDARYPLDPCARSIRRALRATAWSRPPRAVAALALATTLLGCSPALNWRQAGPREVDILLDFPCKPQTLTQPVLLAGKRLDMSMTGCEAAHMTFALAHADVGDPARVGPALAELRHDALANIRARVLRSQAATVPHAAPRQPDAVEIDLAGQGPGGEALREHVLLFAQGTQVFQAIVLAGTAHYQDDAAHTFASSVQLGPNP